MSEGHRGCFKQGSQLRGFIACCRGAFGKDVAGLASRLPGPKFGWIRWAMRRGTRQATPSAQVPLSLLARGVPWNIDK